MARRRRHRRRKGVLGKLLTLILLALAAAVFYLLYQVNILPFKYFVAGALLAALLVVLVGVLTWNIRHKARFLLGTVLWFVLVCALTLGGFYLYNTHQAMQALTGVNTEISRVGVYVRSGGEVSSLEDTRDLTYGILSYLDTENTTEALSRIGRRLGGDVKTTLYNNPAQLMDGLMDGEVGAIVLNEAYLELLQETEGYADIRSRLTEVSMENVENTIKRQTAAPGSAASAQEEASQQSQGLDISIPGSSQSAPGAVAHDQVYTVYISGIDNQVETAMVAKSRSDVNILATINLDTNQVLLVSTPRDYFVPLSISNGIPDKLTHAGIYGIDVSMDTLGMLYGLDIAYYVRVNFAGFENIVDALGGITVYSEYEFDSKNILGYHFNQGYNRMNGEQALVFARERFSFAEGDMQRGRNQMEVIYGVLEKIQSMGTDVIGNFNALLRSLTGSFETNIPMNLVTQILQEEANSIDDWSLYSYGVVGTDDNQVPYSMSQAVYVMRPDQASVDYAISLMQKVRRGEIISEQDVAGYHNSGI